MSNTSRVATGRGLAALAVAALLGSSVLTPGCARMKERRAERRAERAERRQARATRPPTATPSIVLDGRTTEWPETAAALADRDHLFFRIAVPDEVTLQAASEPVTVLIDLDANPGTGMTPPTPRAAEGLGFDIGIEFSPRDGRGGVSAFALDPGGAHTPLPPAQLALQFAPTHASNAFELRLSRHADTPPALRSLLAQAGNAVSMVVLQDAAGQTVGWSDPETFSKPQASPAPVLSEAALPAKPAGAIRIVSWNVRRAAPMSNAGPFSHVLQALDADAILLQEWTGADAATLQAWFTAVVSGDKTWAARTSADQGVAIVAPHPVQPLGPNQLVVEDQGGGTSDPVRWVAGTVQTPAGNVALASVHLTCCGGSGSPEDQRRLAEAQVINAAMAEAFAAAGTPLRVIGGDINLVGSRRPMEILGAGLDTDGSELAPTAAMVLGDAAFDTWSDASTQFTPGRLDYILIGDGGAQVIHAFVLDTARLGDAALARIGLDRTDTASSDHRPVVVDIRPR